MTPHQHEVLCRLQPRLKFAILARFGPRQADDLLQEANVAIIERADADPGFLVQQPAYLVKAGLWRAADALRREAAYLSRAAPIEAAAGQPPDAPDLLEALAVHQALAGLSDRQRAVAAGLAAGRRKADVAADLGVRPQSLAWHCSAIRQALTTVL